MFTNQIGSSKVFEYTTEKVAHYLQGNLDKIKDCPGVKVTVGSWDKSSEKFVPFMCILHGAAIESKGKDGDNTDYQSGLTDYEMYKKLYPDSGDDSTGASFVKLKKPIFNYFYHLTFNNKAALERDPDSYIDLIHNTEFKQALEIKNNDAYKLAKAIRGPREIDVGRTATLFLNPVYVLRDMARDDMGISDNEMNKYTVTLIGMKKNGNFSYSYLFAVEEGTLFYGQKVERGQSEFDRAGNKLFMGQRM